MSQYMLLVYEAEVDPAAQAEREQVTPALVELHAGLREAGLLVGVQRLRSTESATTVRVRGDETEFTDGPFAVTKEVLGGYYVLECADLDEALAPRRAAADGRATGRSRCDRWCADDEIGAARGRRRRAAREAVTTGVSRASPDPVAAAIARAFRDGAHGRAGDADPTGRRLPAGRGRGAGRVRGGGHARGGATASRPGRARGSRSPRGGGRSTGCAATGRWRTEPIGWPS